MVSDSDRVEAGLPEDVDGPSQLHRAVRVRCVNMEVTQKH
jgi:hypothetical protein